MRVILSPHRSPYFGQDFTIKHLVKSMGLIPVYLKGDSYDFSGIDPGKISLIISRYPDHEADVRVMETYGGYIPVAIHLHLRFDFLNADQRKKLRRAVSLASAHFTNCNMLAEEYSRIFPDYDWVCVNNGIDPSIFYPASKCERNLFRLQNGIAPGKILICYCGRLNQAKGLQLLEELLKFVAGSDNYFLIVQTLYHEKYAATISRLRKTYKNFSIYLGQEIKVVRYADLHVSTSLSETTSLVTLEALFSGIPVVCTDVTAFYDELEMGFASFPYFTRIPVCPVNAENSGKGGLCIDNSQLASLKSQFIRGIINTMLLTDDQRQALAGNLRYSKFNMKTMIPYLSGVYGQAERAPSHFVLT